MTGPRTLPELMALAHGAACEGPHACLYCGAPACGPYEPAPTFTGRETLARPGSRHACAGCLLCLEEAGAARYPDGSTYQFTKAFRRMCSWVVTAAGATAATKAHTAFLRAACLAPPEPPYAVSLAVSGQKHVLYRGRADWEREYYGDILRRLEAGGARRDAGGP